MGTKKKSQSRIKDKPAGQAAAPAVSVPVHDDVEPRAVALSTTMAEPEDRMMRYRRNPRCPACDAHPVVCTQRRGAWAQFRCRECGHRWEVA